MRNPSTVWLILAMIAFQGTGLLHALHLAAEHAHLGGHASCEGSCSDGHVGSQSPRSNGEARPSLGNGQGSGYGHGHEHDAATCSVCQTLINSKALSAASSDGPGLYLPPAIQIAAPESVPLSQIALSTLGPRAPPALTPSASA